MLASGQGTYRFRHLGVEHGLSQGSIYNMHKDSRGFMWLGTEDGINRFDGKNIEIYLSGLTGHSTNVLGIAEDSASDLWVGSHKGFYQYLRKYDRFVRPALKHSLGNVSVHTFADSRKNIYLLAETGLYGLKNGQVSLITKDLSYNKSQYNNFLAETPDGDLWLIDVEKGLKRYSFLTKKVSYYYSDQSQNTFGIPQTFNCIKVDKSGIIWLASKEALFRFDYLQNKQSVFDLRFLRHTPTGMEVDNNAMLWLATEGSGIFIFDIKKEKWAQHLRHEDDVKNSLTFNEIGSLYIDENNDVFVNTDPQGLDIITAVSSAFNFYTYGKNPTFSTSDYSIRGIEENADSTIWLGTELGGLNLLEPKTGKMRHYSTQDGLPGNTIRFILRDPENRVWISAVGGFALFLPDRNRFKNIVLPIKTEITSILPIGKNTLLLPCDKGLMVFDAAHQRVTSRSFRSLVMGYGAYWDSTSGLAYISDRYRGVKVFRMEDNKPILNATILDGFHVLQFYRQPNSPFLWACTDTGLVKWHIGENRIQKNYRLSDGLHHEYIYCMLPDSSGHYWLSTNRGITRFDPVTEHFEFVKEIPAREYNSRSALAARNGNLYFGSTAGMDLIKPRLLTLQNDIVGVHLTSLAYDQQASDDSVYIGERELLRLPYSSNTITLKFTATDYRSAGLNRFRYFLKGYDKDTIYAGFADQVRYARLPPGEYEFQLQSSDLGGNWVSPVRKLRVVVLPPFWQTWWFITLALTLLVVICYLSIKRYLDSRLAAQRVKSDRDIYLEKERSRIARDINDSLGSELFGLKLLGQVALSQSNNEVSDGHLQKIVTISKNISEKISEVIWLTDSNQDNLESLWNYLQKNASIYLKPAGITFSFQTNPGTPGCLVSGEKRHEILNFSKQLFFEITDTVPNESVEITFNMEPDHLLITLENSNIPFRESELMAGLLKLNGSYSFSGQTTELIKIPIKD
ncbi:two-component regulator propeller domain-containing protein [Dyadobacter sp. CY323]|uniref:ligand-binding sensor domain-containing protein n=1 Tax=Dyadobacter sp. CY323 TaxID=2907302 RepID=UPI001F2135A0|nr:sensor histidine kinase [Dyadobacter sp. CY323]MCE6992518.1 histidine kinase [Dyadobacter sp. CY323]